MTATYEDHGEHFCGGQIMFDPESELHSCSGMCDGIDLVIEPGECEACEERKDVLTKIAEGTLTITGRIPSRPELQDFPQ